MVIAHPSAHHHDDDGGGHGGAAGDLLRPHPQQHSAPPTSTSVSGADAADLSASWRWGQLDHPSCSWR